MRNWSEIIFETVAQQQAKVDTFVALVERKLPVPSDLSEEIIYWLTQYSHDLNILESIKTMGEVDG